MRTALGRALPSSVGRRAKRSSAHSTVQGGHSKVGSDASEKESLKALRLSESFLEGQKRMQVLLFHMSFVGKYIPKHQRGWSILWRCHLFYPFLLSLRTKVRKKKYLNMFFPVQHVWRNSVILASRNSSPLGLH